MVNADILNRNLGFPQLDQKALHRVGEVVFVRRVESGRPRF
jgi:hypothetical protein